MYPPRQGPRPLPLHLMIQASTLLASFAALPNWKSGSLAWKNLDGQGADVKKRRELEAVLDTLNAEDWGHLSQAVAAEAAHRHRVFLDGVVRYRHHSAHRIAPDYPVVWRQGSTQLLDCRLGSGGPAALVVPSLINRSYILDLSPRTSVVRGLARRGISPFLLDWDQPGADEAAFTMTDYIVDRLEPALEHLAQQSGGKVALVGYCMGGLLALAAALNRPDLVSGLVLLAVPWDFHQGFDVQRAFLQELLPLLEASIDIHGHLPVDMLQVLFSTFDPDLTARKFSAFAHMSKRSGQARTFVLVEDWVNDGVPLVGKVARECLQGWYLDNDPGRGQWHVAGRAVDPAELAVPSMVVVPHRDRIVTPASALALAQALPQADLLQVPGGHVGMLLAPHAGRSIHAPIALSIKKWTGPKWQTS